MAEKDSVSFLSYGKSVGSFLDDRLSNPLVASFIIAWCGLNYKFFIALFSKNTVSETIRIIDKDLYPDFKHWGLQGFIYPFGLALLYLFVVPLATTLYYKWTKKITEAVDNAKYEAEKHKRVPPEETARLQDELRATSKELNEQLIIVSGLRSEVRKAEAQDKERVDQIQRLEDGISALQKQSKEHESTAAALRKDLQDRLVAEIDAKRDRRPEVLAKLINEARGLDSDHVTLLQSVANADREDVSLQELREVLGALPMSMIGALEGAKILVGATDPERGDTIKLTPYGLEVLRLREALDRAGPVFVAPKLISLTEVERAILEQAASRQGNVLIRSSLATVLPSFFENDIGEAIISLKQRGFLEEAAQVIGGPALKITKAGRDALQNSTIRLNNPRNPRKP